MLAEHQHVGTVDETKRGIATTLTRPPPAGIDGTRHLLTIKARTTAPTSLGAHGRLQVAWLTVTLHMPVHRDEHGPTTRSGRLAREAAELLSTAHVGVTRVSVRRRSP